ncbi:MAG: Crossover junction endodeoxyribonuclease RuvC [Marinobacterium sp. xm-d-530]|jgi:crossover junction endodeoxyribonuclease RuvC|nr:MAG: Crossover junction endodeoxyribonuclease RuvC [Marinobacterium sp. xm-d-530]
MLILGIDPGSRITGYGIINAQGNNAEYIASGCIKIADATLPDKLNQVFSGVSELIERYQPQECAIEQVFMSRNADSALKLGQARGAAIVAAVNRGVEVHEYAARLVKQAVAGTGAADKGQVQLMVQRILSLPGLPQVDAADGLAIALCHAYTRQGLIATAGTRRSVKGRWRL